MMWLHCSPIIVYHTARFAVRVLSSQFRSFFKAVHLWDYCIYVPALKALNLSYHYPAINVCKTKFRNVFDHHWNLRQQVLYRIDANELTSLKNMTRV